MDYKEYCTSTYKEIYENMYKAMDSTNKKDKERFAQKRAIRDTLLKAIEKYKNVDASKIWKTIYGAHVSRHSGISDTKVIGEVISADNSWKKSSGHAFEESIVVLGNESLKNDGIRIVLQKELKIFIDKNKLSNQDKDISWLKNQINSSVFDLYAIVERNGKKYVYGCIQTKTSIRDRVTRDREPSIHGMNAFFWSVAIVLDGDFLKLPKFKYMVNGGSSDYPENGWHALYVFSSIPPKERIYPLDGHLKYFVEHAKIAANFWLSERQWMNVAWKAEELK